MTVKTMLWGRWERNFGSFNDIYFLNMASIEICVPFNGGGWSQQQDQPTNYGMVWYGMVWYGTH